jgi:hypothetical protein
MRLTVLLLAASSLIGWVGCTADRTGDGEGDAEQVVDTVYNDDWEPEDGGGTDGDDGDGLDVENENADGAGGAQPEQGLAELSRFESADELEAYFKQQILSQNDRFTDFVEGWAGEPVDEGLDFAAAGDEPAAAPGGEDAPEAGQTPPSRGDEEGAFSETTIQEEGVDEADVVKTDGTYLYVVNDDWGSDQSQLHIVRAVPANELSLLSTFVLEGWDCELYLVGDLVVALTDRVEQAQFGGDDLMEFFIAFFLDSLSGEDEEQGDVDPVEEFMGLLEGAVPKHEAIVTIIDVSDPANPTQVSQTVFEGSIVSSRMIGGVLRLVTAIYPDEYRNILPLGLPQVDALFDFVGLDDLLPSYETVNAGGETKQGPVVGWGDFFRPADPDGFGVTTIITLDTASPDEFEAAAVVAEPGLVYASAEALYLTDTEWYFDFRRVDTDIYKFAFEEGTVTLAGAGTVPGRVLNQYSMGEYEGYLRVATTTDDTWVWETGERIPSSNGVYILGESAGELAIVGSIEDLAIGEEIESARFIGPHGFVVTFERIDPLFTLELSDPTKPEVVGELEVPGYSTFIVPVGEEHLLTVGVYVDPDGWGWSEGVQLSLFDVSNLAAPVRADVTVIGDSNTYSEATTNPKAFTYFAERDLLALPVEHYGWFGIDDEWIDDEDGATDEGQGAGEDGGEEAIEMRADTPPPEVIGEFRGLFVYRVTTDEGFDYLGRVGTDVDDEDYWYWWPEFTRAVFIADQVYAVTAQAVVTAPVADLDSVTASLKLPRPEGGGGDFVGPVGGSVPDPEEPARTESDADTGPSSG